MATPRKNPLTAMVAFFINEPLTSAQMALGTLKTIVEARTKNALQAEALKQPKKRVRVRKPAAGASAAAATPGAPAATAGPVAVTAEGVAAAATPPKPRGRPRLRPPVQSITEPGAVVSPVNPTGAMPPLGVGTTTQQG